MQLENSDLKIKSDYLKGKKIILGITGSIAAVESVKLIHELRRHGGEVNVVATNSALKLIGVQALEYASENIVVTEITGKIEHVSMVRESDIFIVAPATANTISKMACGIDDTPVTSFFTNALGKIPVVVVPAMHEGMYSNPIIRRNIENLKSNGVIFVDPKEEEGKAKISDTDTIVSIIIRTLNKELEGKKVCIIGGSSIEYIDDVRVITNTSSGETSLSLAKEAFYMGADVDLYFGMTRVQRPGFLKFKDFTTVENLLKMKDRILKNDVIIVPAALSDFTPEKREGKISSDEGIKLNLKPTPKVLKVLAQDFKGKLIGFKAEIGISEEELIERARRRLKEYGLYAVVANDLNYVKAGRTRVYIVTGESYNKVEGEKDEVARKILRTLC